MKDQCAVSIADEGPVEMALKEPKKIFILYPPEPSDPDAGYDAHRGQGYCACLKAIGVNLFRAAKVRRVLDALKPVTGAFSADNCSYYRGCQRTLFKPAVPVQPYFQSGD
jgi:hypothetical protein